MGVSSSVFIVFIIIVSLGESNNKNQYNGGVDPYGGWCDYGYNPEMVACCDEDDYSCEVRDRAPEGATALCNDGSYSFEKDISKECSENQGVDYELKSKVKLRKS